MLDTYGRKYVDGIIRTIAQIFIKIGLKPNTVTFIALLIGVSSGCFSYLGFKGLAFIMLWISGLFDSVDGSMARILNKPSPLGTLLDITFDRVVELSIILAAAFKFPNSRLYIILLISSILLSMTIFLTVGALAEKKGMKSFYYQAGIAERSEGFIMLSLMILFTRWVNIFIIIFTIMVTITALQRLNEGRKIFRNS